MMKYFSNLLITHQVKTKEITTWRRFGYPILISTVFADFTSLFTPFFVSIEKIYQTRETVFHGLSKHLEFRQKYSAARGIFNSLLGVRISPWNTVARVWYITSDMKDQVWPHFQTSKKTVENTTRSGVVFTSLEVFGNAVKHCLE